MFPNLWFQPVINLCLWHVCKCTDPLLKSVCIFWVFGHQHTSSAVCGWPVSLLGQRHAVKLSVSICHFVSSSLAHCSFTLIIWTSLSRCHFCYKSLICPSAMTFFSSIMSWQHRDRHFFQVLTSHFPLSVTKQNIHVLPRLGCLSCSDESPLSPSQASLKTFPVLPTLCSDSKASHSIRASSLIHRGLVCLPALTHF